MKISSLIILSFFITGCGLFAPQIGDKRPDPVIITNKHLVAYQCPPSQQVDNVTMRDVTWDIKSRKELDAMFVEMMDEYGVDVESEEEFLIFAINQATGDFFFLPEQDVIWTLSADQYAALSANTSDLIGALAQMKAVAVHYKGCTETSVRIAQERNEAEETVVAPN